MTFYSTLTPEDRRELATATAIRACQSRFPPIVYCELFLTRDCTLRCSYCFIKKHASQRMTWETAAAAVDFLLDESKSAKHVSILFFGGEPLLEMDMIRSLVPVATERAAHAKKGISFDMTTNGTLLTEDIARTLASLKVKYLLSIDGTPEDHDRYRSFPGGTGTWRLLTRNIPMLKRYQPWMGVRMTPTPEAAPNIFRGMTGLYKRGVNQFIIGPAHGMDWSGDVIAEYLRQMKQVCDFYIEEKRRKGLFRLTIFERGSLEDQAKKYLNAWGCGAGRGRVCVNVNGDLYGCSKLLGVTGTNIGLWPLGNVQGGFTNVRNRAILADGTPRYRMPCLSCTYKGQCTGGCPAVNWESTGNPFTCGPADKAFQAAYVELGRYFWERWSSQTDGTP